MSSEPSGTSDDDAARRPFLIRCKFCRWSRRSTGASKDLEGLREVPNSCPTCGKPRRFACPACGRVAVMRRE